METNSESGQKPDEQIGKHPRLQSHTHTHTHTQTDKLVNLARQAEFALPVGMIKGKLGYTVICLINVARCLGQKNYFVLTTHVRVMLAL